MKSYSELAHKAHDFEVCYRFFGIGEGGLLRAPRQHIRWDFMYDGDDPKHEGIFHIWPEFVNSDGEVYPEGEVPSTGKANMYIVFPGNEIYHRQRMAIGTRGFFMEGDRKVAECEVTAISASIAPME